MKELFERILEKQKTLTEDQFTEIFDKPVGAHIWGKYRQREYSLLWLYNGLDTENREKLLNWLKANIGLDVMSWDSGVKERLLIFLRKQLKYLEEGQQNLQYSYYEYMIKGVENNQEWRGEKLITHLKHLIPIEVNPEELFTCLYDRYHIVRNIIENGSI